MHHVSFHYLVFLAALMMACGASTSYSPQQGTCPKREDGCSFEVISGRPSRDYQVIGVIDIEAFHAKNVPNDEASFRRVVGAEVCRAGGDAVIPGVDGDRRYVLATVVRWVDEGQREPVCPKAVPDTKRPDATGGGSTADKAAQAPAATTAVHGTHACANGVGAPC